MYNDAMMRFIDYLLFWDKFRSMIYLPKLIGHVYLVNSIFFWAILVEIRVTDAVSSKLISCSAHMNNQYKSWISTTFLFIYFLSSFTRWKFQLRSKCTMKCQYYYIIISKTLKKKLLSNLKIHIGCLYELNEILIT